MAGSSAASPADVGDGLVRRLQDAEPRELDGLLARRREVFASRFGAHLASALSDPERLVGSGGVAAYVAGASPAPVGFAEVVRTSETDVLASLWVRAGQPAAAHALVARVRFDARASGRRLETQDLGFGEADLSFALGRSVRGTTRLYLGLCLGSGRSAPRSVAGVSFRTWRDGDLHDAALVARRAFQRSVDVVYDSSYRSVSGCLQRLYGATAGALGPFDPECSPIAVDGSATMLGFGLVTWVDPVRGHLVETAVIPEASGRGIGASLLDRIGRGLERKGASEMTLAVSAANERARRLYERKGFVCQREFRAYVLELGKSGSVCSPILPSERGAV